MKFIPLYLRYFIKLFLSSILIFVAFRIVFFFVEIHQLAGIPSKFIWLLQSFFMGFRFDCLVTAYLISPLFLFLIIAQLMRVSGKRVAKMSVIYCLVFFMPAFFICAADIPFYTQFGERFSSTAFEWNESKSFMLKLIFSNFSYWGYLFLFLTFYGGYFVLLRRVSSAFLRG